MTFKELVEILRREGVDENRFDICGFSNKKCSDGFGIEKASKGYYIYSRFNRHEDYYSYAETEHDACMQLVERLFLRVDEPFYDKYPEFKKVRLISFDDRYDTWKLKHKKGLNVWANEYEEKQKMIGIVPDKMTFDYLKYILIREEIPCSIWAILGNEHISGQVGLVIRKAKSGYDLCFMERGVYEVLEHAETEHDVCLLLLNELVEWNYWCLVKYINYSEMAESSLKDFNQNELKYLGYDLKEAIVLSKKLGRALTEEEVIMFKKHK